MLDGPRIVDLDDVPEQEVVRIEFADGRTASIYERFLETSPRMFSFYNRWDPGMMSLRHGHQADHVVYVLAGEVLVGDRLCRQGSHIFLIHGNRFGPWIAGSQGCELLGIIAGNPAAFWGPEDMQAYEELLASHGAKMGAINPVIHLPPWMPQQATVPGPIKHDTAD
jgi:hypothetical protein